MTPRTTARRAAALLLAALPTALLLAVQEPGELSPAEVDFFEKKVRPILVEYCYECHSAQRKQPKAGLRLDTKEGPLRGGDSGPALIPGDPGASRLIQAVRWDTQELQMPPEGRIEAAELADLIRWVEMGAPDPRSEAAPPPPAAYDVDWDQARRFWSFQPLVEPPLPQVRDVEWPANEIDYFVLAKLEEHGLKPAPPAERRALIRRLSFDLLGLPPAPEEIDAFLADETPGAYERLVDRLLASPHYGERWGRYWLDLARYADSNGVDENLAYGHAWRYRDYVVRAFNDDKPYDRFLTEQIAGDLLPEPAGEPALYDQWTATGFLVLGPKMLAEQDKDKLVLDVVDEQLDVLSQAVMGLTVGCARCHDHKFDPIPTADYYALAGVFKSTSTMANLEHVSKWRERELCSAEQRQARDRHQERLKEARAGLERAERAIQRRFRRTVEREAPRYLAAAREALQHVQWRGAADAVSSNLHLDRSQYGAPHAPVLHSHQPGLQYVEFAVELATAGRHRLEVRYGAQESRPMRLLVDGAPVLEPALEKTTGSWTAESLAWFEVAQLELPAGRSVIRFERDGAVPHINHLLLVAEPSAAGGQKWPEALAAAHGLHPQVLRSFAELLAQPRAIRAPALAALAWGRLGSPWLQAGLEGPASPLRQPPSVAADFALPEQSRALAEQQQQLAELEAAQPAPFPAVMAVAEGQPVDLPVHVRGSHLNLAAVPTPRGFLRLFEHAVVAPAIPPQASGRLELARWLTDPAHPLTARVMANRVWQGHFGHGLVRTPSNFGSRGEAPSHPELLDWLAASFRDGGWSLKKLHRRILLSRTYRMSSGHDAAAAAVDPDNRLLWRQNLRRLEAEPLRDALLAVAGTLDRTVGGSLLATENGAYVTNDQSKDQAGYDSKRRSLYLPVIRNAVYEVFSTFDYNDPSVPVAQRPATTVAPQALFALNSPLLMQCSEDWARGLLARDDLVDRRGRVAAAYLQAYGRPPAPAEADRAVAFLERQAAVTSAAGAELEAWTRFCQVLYAASEFLYVD